MKRVQQDLICRDLSKKMVFRTGPRQVGKTSLALAIAEEQAQSVYLNYDNFFHRKVIRQAGNLPAERRLTCRSFFPAPPESIINGGNPCSE